jgi:hypothetical protein
MRELTSPAREILDYLLQHPGAQDTFEGIMQWWVLEQSIKTWLPRVEQAIAELVHRGWLEMRTGANGVLYYRANRAQIAALRRRSARVRRESS